MKFKKWHNDMDQKNEEAYISVKNENFTKQIGQHGPNVDITNIQTEIYNSIHQTVRRVEELQTLNVLDVKMGEEKNWTCLTRSNDHLLGLQRYPLGFSEELK